MKHEPTTKPSGGDQTEGGSSRDLDALVDEASMQSFPCSDAPAFTSLRVGPPAPEAMIVRQPRRRRRTLDGARRLARTQGVFLVASGLWPVVHMRSFEAMTGAKRERWPVRTLGLLLACLGSVLVSGSRSRITRPLVIAGAGIPAVLAAVDLYRVARRRSSKVYLLDAAIELGVAAAWSAFGRRRGSTSAVAA